MFDTMDETELQYLNTSNVINKLRKVKLEQNQNKYLNTSNVINKPMVS